MSGIAKLLDRPASHHPADAATLLSLGRPVIAAAGPWLFTIAAIVVISLIAAPVLSRAVVSDFRGFLIYAFSLSLIASAPCVMIVNRVLSDAIYAGRRQQAQPAIIVAATLAAIGSAGLALVVGRGIFAMPAGPLFALVQAAGLTGMMWVHVAAASAMREYTVIGQVFVAGLLLSIISTLTVVLEWHGSGTAMAYAFNTGFATIPLALAARELKLSPAPQLGFKSMLAAFTVATRRNATIAWAGVLAAIAVWIDKWIMWAGPSSRSLSSGLVHAPLYDSAAFLATLTIVPVLSRFVSVIDSEYVAAYRAYFNAIQEHATLAEIERNARNLGALTSQILESMFIMQSAICVIVVLCAPQIIATVNLQFAQVPILRLCTIATLFQMLFLASCSLLIFFERHREFLHLQALFLTLTAVGTAVTLHIGPESYGFGLLVASVVSGIAAYRTINDTLTNLNFLTFVDGAVRMHQRDVDQDTGNSARWSRWIARDA